MDNCSDEFEFPSKRSQCRVVTDEYPSVADKRRLAADDKPFQPSAKRRLPFAVENKNVNDQLPSFSQDTLLPDYLPQSQDSVEKEEDAFIRSDDGKYFSLLRQDTYTIGRNTDSDILVLVQYVSSKHAVLRRESCASIDVPLRFTLEAIKPVWILNRTWAQLHPNESVELRHGTRFSLAPPHPDKCPDGARFTFESSILPTNRDIAGSESFDCQYMQLLRRIREDGADQNNKKGPNRTLGDSFQLKIDLRSQDDKNLVPMTSLRNMLGGRKAIVEALWYLRGEDHIKFLQENRCPFWDAQAKQDGFVGLSYGLLTNWPSDDGTSTNQLEENVISPLCAGKRSRNMVCTLLKPGEETVQGACTSSVQFAVTDGGELSLTVTQRSSDVDLGLPHDVIAWTVILHLVRREVKRRSGRTYNAGYLFFFISPGGAHVYRANEDTWNELLKREPIRNVQPYLNIESEEDIYQMASNYSIHSNGPRPSRLLIAGYGKGSYHPYLKISQAT